MNTAPDATASLTIPALLQRSTRDFGADTYLATTEDRLTYQAADQRSADAARWLLARGVGKGTRVGLFFPNGVDWAIWWLAAARIGALVVPLSTLYTPAEIAKVLRLADIAMLIAPARVLSLHVPDRLEAALPGLVEQQQGHLALATAPYLRSIVVTDGTDRSWATPYSDPATSAVPQQILAAVEAEVFPADPAIMVYTSGSTADPKGVVHTHGTLVRQTSTWPGAIRSITGQPGAPRILCAMPFFWIGGVLAAMGALHESTSVSILDGEDIVYVARVPVSRIMTVSITIGTRFPAFSTSMGRVLLAGLSQSAFEDYMAKVNFTPLTDRTVLHADQLREEVGRTREAGYCLVDQELEQGLRSMAAPIRDHTGTVCAAVNISTHAARYTADTVRTDLLPPLLSTAAAISADLSRVQNHA